jgi:Glyoxalase-like domain
VTYRIDHVVYAVRDLDVAAARWEGTYGLSSVPGGHHARWGTANRIVPLGEDYLELIAVVEPATARSSVLGRTLMDLTADGDRWFSVCLADDDIGATAARLRLSVEPGSRTTPEGVELRWRGAGIDAEGREPWLPFFIAWDLPAELHPGRTRVRHRVGVEGIAEVEVAGDAQRLRDWLGGADVPLSVAGGPHGVRSVSLRRSGEEPLTVT